MTHAQETLWFIEQLNPGTAAYNLPEGFLLKGNLDRSALEQSLNRLIARHETLRTFFKAQDGKPKQFIQSSAHIDLDVYDLRQSLDLRSWLRMEAVRPFDLGQAPLARATLFRVAPHEHVLLINMHHIISDAWSQGIFIREMTATYNSLVTGVCSKLPELPVQYADFALWQQELIDSAFGNAHLDYWRKKFQQAPEPVLLPTDYPPTRTRTFAGMTQFDEFPQALTQSLKQLSRQEGVTLFMTLLAGFKALLHRYTGNDKIVVGSPMACRERVEVESLVGYFVHTQAISSDVSGDPCFTDLVGRVRESVLEACAHQEVPCQLAAQGLEGPRHLGSHPLFQVVFGWQNASPHNWTAAGLEASKIEVDTATSKFDWTVLVTESANRLLLRSEFSTDLFAPATMERFMRQFRCLLESVVAAPTEKLSRLSLQSPAEVSQVTSEWNRTDTEYERDLQIHQVFERQVAQSPDAIALSFKGREMTYAQLNSRANQLARRLRQLGVGNGTKVGLCLDRSFDLIVGILGILKAGGAYVPLDPDNPRDRLEFMFRDCNIQVLVTQGERLGNFPIFGQASVCVDKFFADASTKDEENLPTLGGAENLAYVMYTSGSSGAAKGVLIPHRGVIRLVRNTNYLAFRADQVYLQAAPVSFDASTFEIWGALLNGARLVLLPQGLPSLEDLGRLIREERVDTLWLTAGLFAQMVDHQLEDLRGLKYLLAGGDVLSAAHVAKAVRELPDCQLINGYGPTENTTFTCCYKVPKEWSAAQSVPIGRPVSNTRVYVLDRFMNPTPIGVPGELYTGGDGLALEYLNRPELTIESFVHNPFDARDGSRLYRTGDIARWKEDGNLEFLGRADGQTKIRGYRIEPGEVEEVLVNHPMVATAVVVVREDPFIGKHLVAYVVGRGGSTLDTELLRELALQKLPTYMVPSRFVVLDRLPLTPNGKVDRRALPAPEVPAGSAAESSQLPSTPLENTIARIWCEILGLSQVRTDEDFFRLGGHSLLATQVISRISKSCRVEVPVLAIFEAPTIAKLAKLISTAKQCGCSESVLKPAPSGAARAADLLARLDEFSEEELEELLRDSELKTVL